MYCRDPDISQDCVFIRCFATHSWEQGTHLELQQRWHKVQQVRGQKGAIDAPVALGGA